MQMDLLFDIPTILACHDAAKTCMCATVGTACFAEYLHPLLTGLHPLISISQSVLKMCTLARGSPA